MTELPLGPLAFLNPSTRNNSAVSQPEHGQKSTSAGG